MKTPNLSENMKKVLCGITSYPYLSNNALSKKISVNPSTISTSWQRLKEKKLVINKYIPNFLNMERSEVIISTGKYTYSFPENVRSSVIGLVFHPAIPFLKVSDNISWLVMGLMSPDFISSVNRISSFPENYAQEMTFNVHSISFDSDSTGDYRYFDFAPLLLNKFDITMSAVQEPEYSNFSNHDIKKKEKLVFQSLIKRPDLSDYQRSNLLGISHPVIKKIRKSLIERGIIQYLVEPNLKEFGYNTFAWFNIKLNDKNYNNGLVMNLCNFPNNILYIHNEENIFMLSVFGDFNEIMDFQHKIDKFMSETGISYEDIFFNYFSIEHESFNMNLNSLNAASNFFGIYIRDFSNTAFDSNSNYIGNLLRGYFSQDEVSGLISEITNTLEIGAEKSGTLESNISIILELLTENKYLKRLSGENRALIQEKLIEILNNLQIKVGNLGKLGNKKRKRKVLIVEDSKYMVEMLKDLLTDTEFEINGVVDNGEDAFNIYRRLCESNDRPDVILMDIVLKGKDGVYATKQIKEYDPNSNVIVLTSTPDRKIHKQVKALKVNDYLVKPVSKVQLLDTMNHSVVRKEE